jgi:hypothetical protein
MGIAAVLMALMAAAQPPAAPASPPEPPVSVERVREGLQRPALKIPPIEPSVPVPVFRGAVEVDIPLDTPLQAMRRELAAESGYSGRSGFEVIGAVMSIVKRIKAARRAHAEAEIRTEVQAELNAFCAEHDCSVLEDGPPPIEGVIIPRRRPTP